MLKKLFGKSESLLAIDVGSTSVKMVELDLSGPTPSLVNIALTPVSAGIISNNMLEGGSEVAEHVSSMLEANNIVGKRVVLAMPGPSVFTKVVPMQNMEEREIVSNLQFEASNYIPHDIDAVRMDYHIIGPSAKNQLDVLLIAVKNEIIESYLDAISLSGLDVAIVDVDYFALQNMFEQNYPEYLSETVALVNVGARFTGINICRNGQSLFTGDVSVGGQALSEDISEQLGISVEEAEALKRSKVRDGEQQETVIELCDKSSEECAAELHRQLSFFWNAAGRGDEGIDRIMLCGGGALLPGLLEELSSKTGIECALLNPFRTIECGSGFDAEYLGEIACQMGVAIGLGLRQPGDRVPYEEVAES
ncbi:MAG: type IV pilus assembly protein PilM [Bdellovibrionales bacterium]|nr:type IV pilus assembly protein PilM [Bdellovibrionales bacterium]